MTWDEGTVEDTLLSVVRHALWQTPLPSGTLAARRFSSLMNAADKQTVGGLVAASLMEPGSGVILPKRVAARLIWLVHDMDVSNKAVAASLQSLCQLLQSEEIPFFVVKGQTVGMFYPKPELRSPGDIDFYIAPQDWNHAMKVITDHWHPDFEKDDDGEQHISFRYDGTLFEMHYNLYKFYNKQNQVSFNRLLDYNLQNRTVAQVPHVESGVPVLCQPDNILYTFLHLYHHLVELGCGLRQFCDVAMLLRHFNATEEKVSRLEHNLEALDFMSAFRAIGAVLVDYLGLPKDKFPFHITDADRSYSRDILTIVFFGGNFGFYGIEEPLRGNKRYYIKAFNRKVSRYHTFYRLSPTETRSMFCHEIPHKVWQALTGRI